MTWTHKHLMAYFTILLTLCCCALAGLKGAEDTYLQTLGEEHYRCGGALTPHCLHIQVEYNREIGRNND